MWPVAYQINSSKIAEKWILQKKNRMVNNIIIIIVSDKLIRRSRSTVFMQIQFFFLAVFLLGWWWPHELVPKAKQFQNTWWSIHIVYFSGCDSSLRCFCIGIRWMWIRSDETHTHASFVQKISVNESDADFCSLVLLSGHYENKLWHYRFATESKSFRINFLTGTAKNPVYNLLRFSLVFARK